MATSGPGATNLVSAIADAYMDSIPLVAITGQVKSEFIGKMAFQETDFFGMTLPIVKHSYLVMDVNEIPRIMKEAFHLARSGRPGPDRHRHPEGRPAGEVPAGVSRRRPSSATRTSAQEHRADDETLKQGAGAWSPAAKRPVIYAGGGIVSADAHRELRAFAEKTNIPVATTLMGVGVFPETHPALDAVVRHARRRLRQLGGRRVRPAPRASAPASTTGSPATPSKFATQATIVHVDVDASEHNKNKRVALAVVSDVKYALGRLNELIAAHKVLAARHRRLARADRQVEEGAPVQLRAEQATSSPRRPCRRSTS